MYSRLNTDVHPAYMKIHSMYSRPIKPREASPPKERHFSILVRALRPPSLRTLDAARFTWDFYPSFPKREPFLYGPADGHGLDMPRCYLQSDSTEIDHSKVIKDENACGHNQILNTEC